MQNFRILIGSLLMLTFLSGCDDRRILFKEYQKIGEDYQWRKADAKTFTIPVSENKHPFELVLTVRYASSYPYDKLFLQISETAPDGSTVRRDAEVKIRDSNGEFIGEKGYDIIDLEYVLDAKKEFPEFGNYTYVINHDMPEMDVAPMVMEIGMVLRDRLEDQ